jgi:hypothetical protein
MQRRSPSFLLPLTIAAGLLIGACSDDSSSSTTDAATSPATTLVATTDAPTTDAPTTEVPTTDASTTTVVHTVPPVAHIRGTAYTFNTPDPIAGARIAVEELPDISAITAADGSYDLQLPVGATVTPYIEAVDHFGIHTQTFTLDAAHDGIELDGVNFQTPSLAIYDGLKALVGGFTGRDPFEGGCVIVTTVGDARMVGMTFDEFIDFHPHGVEGATVAIEPPLATPIYFNEDVLPDAAQLTTSIDGGVLFPNVPAGEYTLSATKDGLQFATVRATCKDGWVVNANPVWGLHALP